MKLNIQQKGQCNPKKLIKFEIKIEDPDAPEIDRSKIDKLLSKYDVYHIAGFSESKNSFKNPHNWSQNTAVMDDVNNYMQKLINSIQ